MPGFDHVAAIILLALLTIGFLYTLFRTLGTSMDAAAVTGIGFRQAAPSALVLPFVLLYSYRVSGAKVSGAKVSGDGGVLRSAAVRSRSYLGGASIVIALALVGWATWANFDWRGDVLATWRDDIEPTLDRVVEFREPGTRIAMYWSWLGREEAFHWRSNRGYGRSRFNDAILDAFPEHSRLNMVEISRRIHSRDADSKANATPGSGWSFPMPTLHSWWRYVFPQRSTRPEEVLIGQNRGELISVIAYPKDAPRTVGLSNVEVIAFLRQQFGRMNERHQRINGREWVILFPAKGQFSLGVRK